MGVRQVVAPNVGEIGVTSGRPAFDPARDIVGVEVAGSQATSEPRRSRYDTLMAAACIPVGHACSDRFMIDEAYYVAEEIFDILIKKRCRRAKLGLEYRPDSLRWTQLYQLIAELSDCDWVGVYLSNVS